MTAVLLALFTALTYGLANYVAPLLTRVHPLAGVLVVGQTVGVLGAGILLLVVGGDVPDSRHLLYGVLAGVCNAVALGALYPAAAAGPLSIVIPLGATGGVVPVLVAIVSGERPSALQLVGIPIAVAGVVLAAARKAPATPGRHDALDAAPQESGAVLSDGPAQHASPRTIGLTLLSVVGFGGFLTFFGKAAQGGPAYAIFTSRTSLIICTLTVLLVLRPPVRVPRRAVPALALPGLLLLLGTAAYGEASTRGLVSVVAVLATLAPVVTVGLAVLLLGERLAARQQVGVATALAGIVMLAAG